LEDGRANHRAVDDVLSAVIVAGVTVVGRALMDGGVAADGVAVDAAMGGRGAVSVAADRVADADARTLQTTKAATTTTEVVRRTPWRA
jgi:hypothetical protein